MTFGGDFFMNKPYNWEKLYDEFSKMNITASDYAKMKGIHSSTIYTKFKIIRERRKNEVVETEPVDLIPIQVVSSMVESQQESDVNFLQLRYCDAVISIPSDINLKFLKDVLRVVKEVC